MGLGPGDDPPSEQEVFHDLTKEAFSVLGSLLSYGNNLYTSLTTIFSDPSGTVQTSVTYSAEFNGENWANGIKCDENGNAYSTEPLVIVGPPTVDEFYATAKTEAKVPIAGPVVACVSGSVKVSPGEESVTIKGKSTVGLNGANCRAGGFISVSLTSNENSEESCEVKTGVEASVSLKSSSITLEIGSKKKYEL